METLVHWFSQNLSQYISPEGAVFYYFNDSAFGTQGRIACSILT